MKKEKTQHSCFSAGNLFFVLGTLYLILCTFSSSSQNIPARPNPPQLVNDFANVLSASEKENLERKLVAFNDSTSSQIAIVTVKTTDEYPVDDYAIALYRNWGIGQKKKDNGVVILCAMSDRKISITTGYGLEGALPDAICKRIIEQIIKPNFKQQNYFGGLDAATDEIIKRASGEYTADETQTENIQNNPFPVIGIVFLVLLLIWFSRYRSVKRYALLNGISLWAAWALLNAASRRSYRSSGGWGGGSWGGSGGWSSGGGGFGGFGGGSTGGGGASGSW